MSLVSLEDMQITLKQDLIKLFVSLRRWQWRHVTRSLGGDLDFLGFRPRFLVSKALFILISCVIFISCNVAHTHLRCVSLCRRGCDPIN